MEKKEIIDNVVDIKRQLKPWDMVSDIHSLNKAWNLVYKEGLGNHQIISQELIRNRG